MSIIAVADPNYPRRQDDDMIVEDFTADVTGGQTTIIATCSSIFNVEKVRGPGVWTANGNVVTITILALNGHYDIRVMGKG